MIPVSAVIITKNEAKNLEVLLPKLTWCDEIVVLDDYSTDSTLEVCKQFGCKTAQRKLENFGLQKQYAVSLAKNQWVFSIDADELPTEELIAEIQSILTSKTDIAAYYIRRQHIFMKRVFKYSAESKMYFIRLFDKTLANFNSNKVHEAVETTHKTAKLKSNILHESYQNLGHYFKKSNHYTTLAAESYFERRKRKSMLLVMLTNPFSFFKSYFVELNFMEGTSGFFWSLLGSWYRIMKYLKLREIYIIEKKNIQQ